MLASTVACQPTPNETAVVYGGGLDEKILASPAPAGAYSAPESWRETLKMKGTDTTVEIDVAISVPDVTLFPVYKVTSIEFDDARIDSLVNYFTKGKEVIKSKEPTKAELEEELLYARKDNDEEWAAQLEKQIAAAPETVEDEIITDWSADQEFSGSLLGDDGEYAGISMCMDTFIYGKGVVFTDSMLSLNDMAKVGEITITEEDAIAAAQKVLHELEINNMAADSMEKAQRYSCLSNSTFPKYSEESVSKGYYIRFARNIDGIPAIVDNGVFFNEADDINYMAPLDPEGIRIYVDEKGEVQSFCWIKPLKIEEKLNENIGLMPFEDIQQRIRNMLTYINSYSAEYISAPIKVSSIEMHMTIVNVKDHPDEAMVVPAWFIHYTTISEDFQQECTLVLNAVDGGRVLEGPTEYFTPDMLKAMEEDQ